MSQATTLFERLWASYVEVTPLAGRIHKLLQERGETVVNDHIALRTFDHPDVCIEVLDRAFVDFGYQPAESYEFAAKKLHACHYEHEHPSAPKVFISALELDHCSESLREIVDGLVAQLPAGLSASPYFPASGRPWSISFETYEALARESEYAAWVAAFGFRPNHFTIDVGSLTTFGSLAELNAFLVENGVALNQSGGVIKGTPADYLEQSATLAEEVEIEFADGPHRVPSCYYEFARRYPLPSGELFQGFVTGSADRLFESTDRR
jgi:hypothetical protein